MIGRRREGGAKGVNTKLSCTYIHCTDAAGYMYNSGKILFKIYITEDCKNYCKDVNIRFDYFPNGYKYINICIATFFSF